MEVPSSIAHIFLQTVYRANYFDLVRNAVIKTRIYRIFISFELQKLKIISGTYGDFYT